jgi:hypothetical protein
MRRAQRYAAGIRDGQQLLSRDVVLGDPEYRATLEVQDEQGRRSISFYPRSRDTGSIPQFRLKEVNES